MVEIVPYFDALPRGLHRNNNSHRRWELSVVRIAT